MRINQNKNIMNIVNNGTRSLGMRPFTPITSTQVQKSEVDNTFQHPFLAPSLVIHDKFYEFSVKEMEIILDEYNKINKPIEDIHLDKLVDDILNGRFDYKNGETIKFDNEGQIVNGQHRIKAHVTANKPFPALVIYGLDPNAILTSDLNRARRLGTNSMLAECRESGTEFTKGDGRNWQLRLGICRTFMKCNNIHKNPSETLLVEFAKKNAKSLDKTMTIHNQHSGYRAAMLGYFNKFPNKAQTFFDLVGGDGSNLPSKSPILVLRRHLTNRGTNPGNKQIVDYQVTLSMINAYHHGKDATKITRATEWAF